MKAVVIENGKAVIKSDVPLPHLPEGYLMVKSEAVGGNPTDWKHIAFKIAPEGSLEGCDVAGRVVAMGSSVDPSEFHIGDPVFGFVQGCSADTPDNGAFAEYVALDANLAFAAPKTIGFSGSAIVPAGPVSTWESAASIPLAWSTAATAVFHNLGMKFDWMPETPQRDFPILIWGGSSIVGQAAIQFAKKYHGYSKIIAVASRKHESLLKSYGADDVFDYHDSDVIDQIKAKYPVIPHLLDLISTEQTFKQVYECAPETGDAVLINFFRGSIEYIPEGERKQNVKVLDNAVFLSLGHDLTIGGYHIKADLKQAATIHKFAREINPKLINGDFCAPEVKVYRGLEGTIQIMDDLEAGKASGNKLCAVMK